MRVSPGEHATVTLTDEDNDGSFVLEKSTEAYFVATGVVDLDVGCSSDLCVREERVGHYKSKRGSTNVVRPL